MLGIAKVNKFIEIDKLIVDTVKEQKGLFIGIPHTDQEFHKHLAKISLKILKDNVDYLIFVEISEQIFTALIAGIELQMKNAGEIEDDVLIDSVIDICTQKNKYMLIPVLVAHLVYKIKVIPIDINPEESNQLQQYFYGKIALNAAQIEQVLTTRLQHNNYMIEKIQKTIADENKKYLVLCGPMHIGIAKQLSLSNMNVLCHSLYLNLQSLAEQDESYKLNLFSDEIKPERQFLYNYDIETQACDTKNLRKNALQAYKNNDFGKALGLFKQILNIEEEVGPNKIYSNVEIATLYYNIGSTSFKLEDPNSALKNFQIAYKIRCDLFGIESEIANSTKTRIEECEKILDTNKSSDLTVGNH